MAATDVTCGCRCHFREEIGHLKMPQGPNLDLACGTAELGNLVHLPVCLSALEKAWGGEEKDLLVLLQCGPDQNWALV